MKNLLIGIFVVLLSVGCGSVSRVGSGAWHKTKALFGHGDEETKTQKVTVETYPSRTTISTLDQPKIQVKTQPKKVEVQVQPLAKQEPATGTQGVEQVPAQEGKADRKNLSPEERRLQEKIDRDVERLRKKHGHRGFMGIFK